MPSIYLTKKVIDEIPHTTKQVLYHDSKLTGFALLVSAKTKTYVAQKNVNGRTVRVTVGRHGLFTPDQARQKAMSILIEMTNGINPNRVKREQRSEIITFQHAFENRMAAKGNRLASSTLKEYQRIADQYFSTWKQRPLTEITKSMIMHRYAEISRDKGGLIATKVMRVFSATYNYARYLNDSLPENPVVVISLTKSWHTSERRQTVVKYHQIAAWFAAVQAEPNVTMRDYLTILLFTGLRKTEAAKMEWKNIDLKSRTMTITQTKNGHTHVLPMGDYIADLLAARWEDKINGYVFPGSGIDGHLKEPKKAIKRVVDLTGIPFSSHDLRRTFVTTAESLDLSHYTVKYLVNHRTNADLTGGYMVLDVERMRIPMRRIEEKLLELIGHEARVSNT